MNTLGAVKGSILRLGKVESSADLTLNMLIALLVAVLKIEKFMSWPTFSLIPTNRPDSSVDVLGKLLSSELK